MTGGIPTYRALTESGPSFPPRFSCREHEEFFRERERAARKKAEEQELEQAAQQAVEKALKKVEKEMERALNK